MKKQKLIRRGRRFLAAALCLVTAAACWLPFAVCAEENKQVVRVGWYESPFNITDEQGRRSGYAYEYQRKIAAYTGWSYEYVEGSWPELLEMLKNGKIDLLSDVTYTKEREEQMLFSSYAMGTEDYYIFVAPQNTEISSGDLSTFNQKKIGVNKDSVQAGFLREWLQTRGIAAQVVEQTGSEDESQQKVLDGELDAFVTLDLYGSVKNLIPLIKIGTSSFCFALAKERTDLLPELDEAMSKIQSENRFYNEQLYEKYFKESDVAQSFDPDESIWLKKHGPIRVAYQNNYLAFCAEDESGNLTGALKDFLEAATEGTNSGEVDFKAVSYTTASEAMDAVINGEADCMFPANLTDYDSETMGLAMTPALMRTEMLAVVRASEQKQFIKKEKVKVAVNEGNANYVLFLQNHFPDWEPVFFKDTPACLEAVAAGEADCILISTYRFNNISKQCEKLRLTTVSTGVQMDYSFAVLAGNRNLYSILAKVIDIVPDTTVSAALTYYSTEDAKTDLMGFFKDNFLTVMLVFMAIVTVIILLLLRTNLAQKKVIESQRQVESLNRRVFVDALTSVRNKGAFTEYIENIQEQLDDGTLSHVAVGMLDCNNLKRINDCYGHDKGDEYLKASSRLICHIFQHSPVFRIGGDEFSIVLMHEDYENKDALEERFKEEQDKIRMTAKNAWHRISVAIGIADYDPQLDSSIQDTLKRADQQMYQSKRREKQKR